MRFENEKEWWRRWVLGDWVEGRRGLVREVLGYGEFYFFGSFTFGGCCFSWLVFVVISIAEASYSRVDFRRFYPHFFTARLKKHQKSTKKSIQNVIILWCVFDKKPCIYWFFAIWVRCLVIGLKKVKLCFVKVYCIKLYRVKSFWKCLYLWDFCKLSTNYPHCIKVIHILSTLYKTMQLYHHPKPTKNIKKTLI